MQNVHIIHILCIYIGKSHVYIAYGTIPLTNVDKDIVYEGHSLQRICATNHLMQHVDTHSASDTRNVDSLCKHLVHLQLAS